MTQVLTDFPLPSTQALSPENTYHNYSLYPRNLVVRAAHWHRTGLFFSTVPSNFEFRHVYDFHLGLRHNYAIEI